MKTTISNPIKFFVDQLCALTNLESAERQALLRLSHKRISLRRGRDLAIKNDHAEKVCIVERGAIAHFIQMRSGHRQYAAIYIPGDACNLETLAIPQSPKPLYSLDNSVILEIDRKELQRVCSSHPGIAEAFWRYCCNEMTRTTDLISSLGQLSAEGRVARFIAAFAHRYGFRGEPGYQFPFPLTQAQVGEAVGLTAVHVCRTMRRLNQAGLIHSLPNCMTIMNADSVMRIAELDCQWLQSSPHPQRISDSAEAFGGTSRQTMTGIDLH